MLCTSFRFQKEKIQMRLHHPPMTSTSTPRFRRLVLMSKLRLTTLAAGSSGEAVLAPGSPFTEVKTSREKKVLAALSSRGEEPLSPNIER